ncbi:MAG: alpha/beta hydrolase [Dehalococcoidia bacterium]|nr:alpha/beta hydrolase [Dehalococcoidia bacterium]
MTTDYVLVHGAGEGNWIWDGVQEALSRRARTYAAVHGSHLRPQSAVNQILAKDLPGHGYRRHEDPSRITLKDYVDAVVGWIEEDRLRNVVLVGHGMAGLILPQVAERLKGRIKRLVFLGALVPAQQPGALERLMFVNAFIPDQEKTAAGGLPLTRRLPFLLRSLLKFHDKRGLRPLHKALAQTLLCNGMEAKEAGAVIGRLTTTPFLPLVTPVSLNSVRGLPSTYVVFTQDRLLPPAHQRRMAKNLGSPEVVELPGGHISGLVLQATAIADLLAGYA